MLKIEIRISVCAYRRIEESADIAGYSFLARIEVDMLFVLHTQAAEAQEAQHIPFQHQVAQRMGKGEFRVGGAAFDVSVEKLPCRQELLFAVFAYAVNVGLPCGFRRNVGGIPFLEAGHGGSIVRAMPV